MLALTLQEIAAVCGGRLTEGDPTAVIAAVSTDTRTLRAGELFVGLRGERFDGGEHAARAVAQGARAVMVEARSAPELTDVAARIVVADTRFALQRLAAEVRRRAAVKVAAITGSAGKTATKDILAALLRPVARVVATSGNLNNEIGVPLTLLGLEADSEVAVVEMGMRGRSQIRELAAIAQPDVGIITTIAPVHLELLGTMADVAAAKAELLESLVEGAAVIPADEPLLSPHLDRYAGRVVTFGGPHADVRLVDEERQGESTWVTIDAFGRREEMVFSFTGSHYLHDAMAAVAAFVELGYGLGEAREGAAQVAFSDLRGALARLPGNGLLLNDAYNANPVAMMAAVDHLVAIADGRPAVAVLGDMYELGPQANDYHRAVGEHCAAAGVRLVAVGELARDMLVGASDESWCATVEECLPALPQLVPQGSAVLVKASRALRLERVAEALRGDGDA
ncbi:MAG: UDP-N-acetylmuramoyl-tripeptide--D-alanyl-D-alanine ligase [Thermoleophilia bacterium]